MLLLIESFGGGDDRSTVSIDGQTFPASGVLETSDGVRIALFATTEIPVLLWTRAYERGVLMIVVPEGDRWRAITAHRFAEVRPSVSRNRWVFDLSEWGRFDHFPTFDEVESGVSRLPVSTHQSSFVHLHNHSEFSPLDGLSDVSGMVKRAALDGHGAMAITDHGVCAAHPSLQTEADRAGIKPIFGIEAYFVPDRHDKDKERRHSYHHLILLAQTTEGLHNLWAMSTEANRTGFYGHPRMDWEVLERYAEGVMATTACLRGPLADDLLEGNGEAASMVMSRLLNIFGDRLYVEIQTNRQERQRTLNERLVGVAREFSVPVIAAVDSHYIWPDDKQAHKIWLAVQTNTDLRDDTGLFEGDDNYHMMAVDEVRSALDYLPESVVEEAIANTGALADRCGARLDPITRDLPVFSKEATKEASINRDVERLVEVCLSNWHRCQGRKHSEQEYMERFERELRLLVRRGFCGYFLIVSDYCLDPSTPVLTADLKWVEVGSLQVGDRLVGFDEGVVVKEGNRKGHRYWRGAEVVNTRRVVLPTYKVVLEDGTETIVSEDHQWLISKGESGNKWVKTKDLASIWRDHRFSEFRSVPLRAQRLVPEWDEPNTWEAGYLAGILDGEGYLSMSKMNNGGHSFTIGFAQREGEVLSAALGILDGWGFDYSVKDNGKSVKNVTIRGGLSELLRLLGMTRPKRLLSKLDVDVLGRVRAMDKPAIVSVEPLGRGEVVALETTTGTLVAQGIAHHNCRWARSKGVLVGPGRGSGGGSLVAYLCDITSLDPVEHDLIFERFLTEGRIELPDFDVDFPASKRQALTDYLIDRWGEKNVVRVGTHIRVQNRGVVRDMARVLKGQFDIHFPDIEAITKIIEATEADKAGLGMSWEDLWDEAGDLLEPYRNKYPVLFESASQVVGKLKTYGKHPAGMVVSTDTPLVDRLPLRGGEDGMVAEFDLHALEALGLVKLDLLTLRTLDTIQQCVDLIREQRGDVIDVYSWDVEYRDPQVWDEISEGHTLGIFQIETPSGTRDTKRLRPRSIDDLADVITLVRPGPKRSGLAETYFRRRAGEEMVSFPEPRLEPILAPTYGVMLYQEQLIQMCMTLAGYTDTEADAVRKILGKKLVEKVVEAGEKFVSRAVANGTDQQVASLLWEQMAEWSRYGFGKAHAYGYATLGFWTGWVKYHYPVQFLTAAFSTIDKGRIPAFVQEARRMGYRVLPPDINLSGEGFSAGQMEIRYGFDGVKGVGAAAVKAIIEGQPYESWEDFVARKGKANWGVVKTLASVGAFDSLVPNRRALEERIEWETTDVSTRCVYKDEQAEGAPNDLPCRFDWLNEEVPLNDMGQKIKLKPLPKRCTKACRNYTPPAMPAFDVDPYLPEEVMEREMELLGIHLSHTPFDRVPEELWDEDYTSVQLGVPIKRGNAVLDGPEGTYLTIATLTRLRPHVARNGKEMGFTAWHAVDVELDVVVFSDEWKKYRSDLRKNDLYIVGLHKTDRGLSMFLLQNL